MLYLNERRRLGLKFDEFCFVDDYKACASDADISTILFCKNQPEVPSKAKSNMGIDLRKEPEEIFAGFSSSMRQDIRRAMRDDEYVIERQEKPSFTEIESFCKYFNVFSRQKGIYTLQAKQLMPFVEKDAFTLTKAMSRENGATLYMMTYIRDESRVSAFHGCSHFRSAKGSIARKLAQANKYLQYQNMLYFRDEGRSLYDLGGYYEDENNEPVSGIDKFKKGFGGEKFLEYSFFYPRTAKGKLFLKLRPRDHGKL